NHLVTLRQDVYRSHPWMAERLMAAFDQAKKMGAKQLAEQAGFMLPWMSSFVDEVFRFFGGHPYKDGFEANYAAIKLLCQYCFEQGLTKRLVDPEELFAPETLKLVF
ncbi:MAG: ABC transporter substrate-binding protein, partial [Chloroflexota bacterium]